MKTVGIEWFPNKKPKLSRNPNQPGAVRPFLVSFASLFSLG